MNHNRETAADQGLVSLGLDLPRADVVAYPSPEGAME
jgi:hypothetical protein